MAMDTLSVWHRLLQAKDAGGLDALLADEVVFHSPIVHTPQVGKAITTLYLSAAFMVFNNDTFRYVREVKTGNDAVLEFVTVIDGITVNGVDMIRWNEAGQIIEFKVMVRPLKAINLIHQKMGEMLKTLG
jgi:ketosteroid isomerase-like protein